MDNGDFILDAEGLYVFHQVSEVLAFQPIKDTKSGFYLDNVKPGFLELFQKETQLYMSGDQGIEDMWGRIDEFWHEK